MSIKSHLYICFEYELFGRIKLLDIKLACYTGPWGTQNLIRAIAQIAAAGFDGIECPAAVVQQYEDRLNVFEEILIASNIKLAGIIQPVDLFADEKKIPEQVERTVNSARFVSAAGASLISIVNVVPIPEDMNDERMITLAAIVCEMSKRCAELGVKLAFLPRAKNVVAFGKDLKRLLESDEDQSIGLALDTAEMAIAEVQAGKIIKTYSQYLRYIRFRDLFLKKRRADRPSAKFGKGEADFLGACKALKSEKYSDWITVDITGETIPLHDAASNALHFMMKKSGLFEF